MKAEILKDVTVTVTAGQIVDIREDSAAAAVRLGYVKPAKDTPAKKTTKKG